MDKDNFLDMEKVQEPEAVGAQVCSDHLTPMRKLYWS